ncbi:sorbitol/mannitol transport system substrate-binding protein [Haloechinothrix alba]|uniref:Sorbitol/mannitol transport system substrate-binding protein n=1 Tax=Haloechinothrix alba TaxID=664784 RepID=A0A238VPI3_9PSEU|nr:sugar ABC transporter substrate-binding protein [Haloechinothrix alba]SNR36245.1 sorbitol/mannitol transport system substrate-binding protein [Haloechinothrix alba]
MQSRRRSTRLRTAYGVALSAVVLAVPACAGAGGGGGGSGETITIATVGNPQMQDIEQLSSEFESEHDISVEFVTLPENELRDQVTQDIATGAGQYDIVTIGTYETPIWAENEWIEPLDEYASEDGYDVDDILTPVRDALSYEDTLYAAPFYGESSFLMYREDLLDEAGLTMPEQPTWEEVAELAAELDEEESGTAGICLRGLPGWGEVLAPLNTIIHTFGGRWYDEDWNAQLTSEETTEAVQFYVDLVREHGQPGAANSGFTECMTAVSQGDAAMWYDATVGASSLEDPNESDAAGRMGYAQAPVQETEHGGWLWAWSLAIPSTSERKDAAWEFISWATSKEYIQLVGEELGWTRVPPGSRASTYEIPEYQEEAGEFAEPTLEAIEGVDVNQPGLHEQPWVGVQYIAIPEFQDLGTRVSQEISAAIAGRQSVTEALDKAQSYAEETAESGGYSG